ncbi:MAG: iron ABC transporter permease, partial [Spirochaetales bacterium]|nr:iron ABC transporter permease [Spirochaetales bacterium]
MTRVRPYRIGMLVATAILLMFTLALSLSAGSVQVSLGEIIGILFGKEREGLPVQIVKNIRLPRTLVGLLVGMNLAVSGVLLQGIIRNPMASP